VHGNYSSAQEVMSALRDEGYIPQHTDAMMAPKKNTQEEASEEPNTGIYYEGEWITRKKGGSISLDVSGVSRSVVFEVPKGALDLDERYITMALTYVKNPFGDNIILFSFGPSGTEFYPYSCLIIPFELMTNGVDGFAITDEHGNDVEGVSFCIDYKYQVIVAYIPHFSMYYFPRR
jgi:hypothetical protein